MARILVIDDESLPARLIARFLCANGHEALPVVWMEDLADALLSPWDVACVDLVFDNQPGSGLDVLDYLTQLPAPPKLVLLCSIDQTRRHLIETAFSSYELAGAIPKDAPEDILLRCLDAVLAGEHYIDHKMTPFRQLTPAAVLENPTHARILCSIAKGNHNQSDIAADIGVATQTVANAVRPIGDALKSAGLIHLEQPRFNDILAWASANAPFLLKWNRHNARHEHGVLRQE
jgi:DNA-binding NarL/FixJ family response regulator